MTEKQQDDQDSVTNMFMQAKALVEQVSPGLPSEEEGRMIGAVLSAIAIVAIANKLSEALMELLALADMKKEAGGE